MQKQGLELKQTQRLSPLQIQTIKLIELPVQELEQKIRSELEENPVLEDDAPKDVSIDEIKEEEEVPSYKTRVNNWGKDPRPEYNTFSVQESFTGSLMEQLGYRELDERQHRIASFIIGSLDSDGYLRRDISSLVDDMAFRAGLEVSESEVEQMLSVVQEFDPPGVGARDLRECLLIQLRSRTMTQDVKDAYRILDEQFQEFTNRHFNKVMSRLGMDENRLKAAIACITRLNPAPGGQMEDGYAEQARQIVPDFVLEENNGKLSFIMPRFNIPELKVNRKYSDMMNSAKDSGDREQKEAATFIRQKIDSAKWFIEALKQRQNTLQRTMQAILDFQHDYFLDGDESNLKPMVLKDIAEKTGFDISTISRVVNSKYIETHFGIFPLKYFFSEGMENNDGEEVSTRELKRALQDCVDAENKRKPLTDEQLVAEMEKRGYKVARRTIAKYRGQLGIPLARWRKEL